MTHRIKCAEIWGGIRGDVLDVETSGIRASLFSRACEGGKGGDIYYFSVCGSDLLTRIAIADVMGHGEKVSATSQWLYDSLEANMNSADGSRILADLNRAAVDFGYKAMATAAIAAFYRADRNLYFSYAGHHEVLVKRKSDSNWEPLGGKDSEGLFGLPLGVDDETEYLQNSVPLAAGDRLFMYTDGIVEAPDDAHQEFGEQRLIDVLKSTANDDLGVIRSRVLGALLEHTDDELGHDDVTFMAVEILE